MIIDQPVVSGSLNVSGSSTLIGNLTVTGSIIATEGITISGSIASASFASTASNSPLYLLTSSFESYSSSIKSRIDSVESNTGSFATTGSNTFKGTQTVSGSIIPVGSGSYDLGDVNHPFRHLYLSSASLYIDGQKVIGSTAQELQITTDTGQSIKILEGGTDNITLQSVDGNIELKSSGDGDVVLDPTNGKIVLKGTTEIFSGYKIQSSVNGNPVVFASDVIVSGGITTTGQIIAQSINVQQVTSSIVYSSGSNVFGNDLLNTQTLTGSVNITGSLKLNNSNVVLTNQTGSMSVATSSLALTASYVGNAQTASYILQAVSSSYATTASYALNVPVTSSYSNQALSSSYSLNTTSASFASQTISSSFATTASYALNVPVTASFANEALSSSFATNASTASYLLNAPATASYANQALSSSYATTASFSLNVPVTSSYSNQALSSSYATTASFSLSGTGFPFSGSAEITGSLLITNLTGSGVRYMVADANGNISSQTPGAVIKSTQQYTATSGQSTFTVTNGYTTGLVDVFVNGTKLSSDEFVDTSGTSVVITGGVVSGTIVEIVKYLPSAGVTNNVLRELTTFNVTSSQSTFNVNYTPGLLDVYYNGSRLSSADYEASNGTSILFATSSVSGDTVDVMVYSYQVGAFNGIGGGGASTELSYFNSQSSITSSQNLKFDGSNLVITGSIVSTQGLTGSLSGTSSYANNANLLDGLDSLAFVQTGSFQSYTSSFSSSVATTTLNLSSSLSSSIGSLSSSVATTTSGLSSSVATTTLNLSSSVSSSIGSLSGSIATTTSNLSSSIGSLSSSVATTTNNLSSSIATTTSGLASRIGSVETKTGSYATTGSNIFVGSQTITGSLYITTDLIVQGCSCLQNITASAVSIGTNIVMLNTATPAVRFAGISVQDSGSNAGITGSIYWDGLCNKWIYSNPSNVGYSGGMLLSGPRNTGTIGNEAPLTCNYIAKSGGGDHLYDSCIYEVSGSVGINTATPCSALQVNKSSQTYTGSTPSGGIIVSNLAGGNGVLELGVDTTYLGYIQSRNITSTTTYNLQLQPLGGAVGVGTISPYSNGLSVRGTSDDYSLTILQQNANTAGYGLFAGNSGDFSIARFSGGAYVSPALKIQLNTNIACFSSRVCAGGVTSIGDINFGIGAGAYEQVTMCYGGYNGGSPLITMSPITVPGAGALTTQLLLKSNGLGSGSGCNHMGLQVQSSTYLATCNGNVGIGTLTPDIFSRGDALNVGISTIGASDNMSLSLNAGGSAGRGAQIYMGQGACRHLTISSNGTESTIGTSTNTPIKFTTLDVLRFSICANGVASFACDLTAKTIGTNDLKLSNINYECANYVDGTRGSWLIQEGENDLFIINQISCKKYKFNLIEIK